MSQQPTIKLIQKLTIEMKTPIIIISSLLIITILTFSCKKEKATDPEPTATPTTNNQEFIADTNSFVNFMTWTVQSTKKGPSPSLSTAHVGNDTSVTRRVYFKNGQDPINGKYPIGTIIVKHGTNPAGTVNELTAMVKRGNNFNSSIGDWEFFMLSSNGKIAKDANGNLMRGASLMSGMCGGCHGGASAKDYIFSK